MIRARCGVVRQTRWFTLRLSAIAATVCLGCGQSACSAADDGLVGYWRFDSPAQSITDRSGHGHVAHVSGGKVVVDGGKRVLALDGRQQITVPSSRELDLCAGFSIAMKIKIDDLAQGHTILFKDGQYVLRINWPEEGSQLSFFPRAGGRWEPRVTADPPAPGTWTHLVATWDGHQSMLWVNGIPVAGVHAGKPPATSDAPLVIASSSPHGSGIRGAIEYLKIYRKKLSSKEILAEVFGLGDAHPSRSATTDFDFSRADSLANWTAQADASISRRGHQLVIHTKTPNSRAVNNRLGANIDKRDWLSLRMSVDKGSQARVLFVTTKGAGYLPLQTVADRKPHSYLIECWTQPGWGGELLALGLIPSDAAGSTAHIERLQLSEEPPFTDVRVERIFTDSTLARAGRPERIMVRLSSMTGAAGGLTATLSPPQGVMLKTPASQALPGLTYHDETELAWTVEAERPLTGTFSVAIRGARIAEPVSATETLTFQADLRLPKAEYVPVPVPAKSKYTLWTHYCPLWKTGTHMGWKLIEPWPEREPVLGWYNEGSPEVADWHIKYMLEHGISGIIYCWYRTNLNGPVKQQLGHAIHDGLLKARYLPLIRFGIMWENGCGQGVGSADDLMHNLLPFWIDNYFSNPSYARIGGKPVLYVWVPSNLRSQLGGSPNVRKALDAMRAECRRRGLGGLYLVGCVQHESAAELKAVAAEGWDASSAYCNNWKIPSQVTHVGHDYCAPFEGFVGQQESLWKFKRRLHALPDITTAMMGWDSRPWKETPFFWSDNTAQKFRDLCLRAKASMDSAPADDPVGKTLIFCCWDEFGEGHYIEPTRGKGFSYLDVIRDVFCEGSHGPADIVPADVGLPAVDSWYAAVRESAYVRPKKSLHAHAWQGEALALWKPMMGLGHVEVRDGVLRATSINADPAFVSPPLELRANRFTELVVEMRSRAPSGPVQLFWTTMTEPATSEPASVSAPTLADGRWHHYVLPVATNPHWGGCITSLRFDPATIKDAAIEIKSVRLE